MDGDALLDLRQVKQRIYQLTVELNASVQDRHLETWKVRAGGTQLTTAAAAQRALAERRAILAQVISTMWPEVMRLWSELSQGSRSAKTDHALDARQKAFAKVLPLPHARLAAVLAGIIPCAQQAFDEALRRIDAVGRTQPDSLQALTLGAGLNRLRHLIPVTGGSARAEEAIWALYTALAAAECIAQAIDNFLRSRPVENPSLTARTLMTQGADWLRFFSGIHKAVDDEIIALFGGASSIRLSTPRRLWWPSSPFVVAERNETNLTTAPALYFEGVAFNEIQRRVIKKRGTFSACAAHRGCVAYDAKGPNAVEALIAMAAETLDTNCWSTWQIS